MGLFGVIAAGLLLWQVWSWWQAQSYIPVAAQVLDARLQTNHSNKSGMQATNRASGEYAYRYRGVLYSSTDVGAGFGSDNIGSHQWATYSLLRSGLTSGRPITVWIDPDKPGVSVLTKQFRWALVWFTLPFSLFFIVVILVYSGWFATEAVPARGPLFGAEAGPARCAVALAVYLNLLAGALVSVAVAQMLEAPRIAHLAVLPVLAVGLGLAWKAGKMVSIRRRLGAPWLEHTQAGPSAFKARLHFSPPLIVRGLPSAAENRIVVELRQVQRDGVGGSQQSRIVWSKVVLDVPVGRRSASLDIGSGLPPWPTAREGVTAIYRELCVRAHGAEVCFRLPAQADASDSASQAAAA